MVAYQLYLIHILLFQYIVSAGKKLGHILWSKDYFKKILENLKLFFPSHSLGYDIFSVIVNLSSKTIIHKHCLGYTQILSPVQNLTFLSYSLKFSFYSQSCEKQKSYYVSSTMIFLLNKISV